MNSAETATEAFLRSRDMDASLQERLAAFSASARKFGPALQLAADRWVARLREHGAGEAAPKPGDAMPPFLLPDDRGRLVSLEGLLAAGPVAITFHRGHWCPYCRISMKSLAEAQKKFGDQGQIVAIMPDRQEFAASFKAPRTAGRVAGLATIVTTAFFVALACDVANCPCVQSRQHRRQATRNRLFCAVRLCDFIGARHDFSGAKSGPPWPTVKRK